MSRYLQNVPVLERGAKYILDKDYANSCEVILLQHGNFYGTVMLPYSNDDKPVSWDIMLNRLTKI